MRPHGCKSVKMQPSPLVKKSKVNVYKSSVNISEFRKAWQSHMADTIVLYLFFHLFPSSITPIFDFQNPLQGPIMLCICAKLL